MYHHCVTPPSAGYGATSPGSPNSSLLWAGESTCQLDHAGCPSLITRPVHAELHPPPPPHVAGMPCQASTGWGQPAACCQMCRTTRSSRSHSATSLSSRGCRCVGWLVVCLPAFRFCGYEMPRCLGVVAGSGWLPLLAACLQNFKCVPGALTQCASSSPSLPARVGLIDHWLEGHLIYWLRRRGWRPVRSGFQSWMRWLRWGSRQTLRHSMR